MEEAIWRVSAAQWARVQASHVAAQATVARVVALAVPGQVWVGPADSRGGGPIGQAPIGPGAPQAQAVALLAAPSAVVYRLAELGHDPVVQASADILTGASAWDQIAALHRSGATVWPRRAERDGERLLADPAVWSALDRVTDALQARGTLHADDVDATLGPTTAHEIWVP